jgi:predicted transcriptional regulator of viral defense system
MKSSEFIEILKNSKNSVFTFSQLARILGKKEEYAKVFISRLVEKELLRLERNKYTLKGTNPFLVSSNVIFPSYISFISAYSYYNLTTQLPRAFFVVSLKQKKPISFDSNLIQFVKFKRFRFFGFKREILEGKFVFVAEVEKAILDSLYLPKYCPISETFFAMKNAKLNLEKLFRYAKEMKSLAVIKRLGYLLEIAGIDASEIKTSFKNYTLLNPDLPKKGEKNEKWKLIINEVIE